MSNKKLPDNDIKKALEEVLKLMLCDGDLQRSSTLSKTLDYINRLQAEYERLKEENQEQNQAILNTLRKVRKIRLDAYEEFAERLKEKSWETGTVHGIVRVVEVSQINNLLKEMVG